MSDADETAEWIAQARAGDTRAFGRLVERHRRLVLMVAWQMTGSLPDAEDLAQESFVRAFRGLSGFRGQASFKTWLLRIVTNLSLNWRRAAARAGHPCDDAMLADQASPAPGPEQVLMSAERQRRVRAAVFGLPDHYRSVVVLRDWDALSYQEIAEALQIPIGTVMSRLAKARERLASELRSDVQGAGPTRGVRS